MCGIVGYAGSTTVEIDTACNMLGALRHRGPDEFGIYQYSADGQTVVLGNARLSIIDLEKGQQPISNEDESLWIVLNGEIFNYIELRRDLENLGHRFRTRTDTEVALHMFEQWGVDAFRQLNGQFALAIWDERNHQLFLARDRCGIIPLYYTLLGECLVFASEIKAILNFPGIAPEWDPIALAQVFTYWSPVSPRSIFRGIQTLPPGTYANWAKHTPFQINRYFSYSFPADGQEPLRNTDEAADQLRDLLDDATRIRLRADVKVGAYLSGGLDSSAVTALAREYVGERLETFSVAFADAEFDESPYQQMMASYLGTNHHTIKCDDEQVGEAYRLSIWHAETPMLRTAPAPLFMLSGLVRDHGIKVVLTGEGADEFLGGYNIFKEAKIRRFWARWPESTWRHTLLRRLYPYVRDLNAVGGAFQRAFFGRGLELTSSDTYSHHIRWRNTARLNSLLSPELRQTVAHDVAGDGNLAADFGNLAYPLPERPHDFDRWNALAQAQFLEATIFLPDYLLSSQGDRMLMAHGVEGRFPFLDPRVIDLCSLLAPRLKICGLNEKHVLKWTMRDKLPVEVAQRPKRPYRAPIINSLLYRGELRPWVAELLTPSRIAASGCFDGRAVEKLFAKGRQSRAVSETDSMGLVGVVSTQLIHHYFFTDFRPNQGLLTTDSLKFIQRGTNASAKT